MTAALTVAVGLVFGYALSRVGFSSWGEVNRMFRFADLRLFLGFCGAVAILAVAWAVIRRAQRPSWMKRPLHPGSIPGGVLFGAGWALSGACPSIALVQLGEGRLAALVTLAGVFVGNFLYPLAHERWFRWSTRSCVDD